MTAPKPADLIRVRDVYGDEHRIRRADFDGQRTQIPLYTATGRKFCDHFEAMGWKGRATTIHRENIAATI